MLSLKFMHCLFFSSRSKIMDIIVDIVIKLILSFKAFISFKSNKLFAQWIWSLMMNVRVGLQEVTSAIIIHFTISISTGTLNTPSMERGTIWKTFLKLIILQLWCAYIYMCVTIPELIWWINTRLFYLLHCVRILMVFIVCFKVAVRGALCSLQS